MLTKEQGNKRRKSNDKSNLYQVSTKDEAVYVDKKEKKKGETKGKRKEQATYMSSVPLPWYRKNKSYVDPSAIH